MGNLGKPYLIKIANRKKARSQGAWTTVLGIQLGGEINSFLLGIPLALGCETKAQPQLQFCSLLAVPKLLLTLGLLLAAGLAGLSAVSPSCHLLS